MTTENPYATPESTLTEPETGERSKSPKVIGIISMLISIVSILMTVVMLIALFSGLSAVLSELKATGISGAFAYVSVGLGVFSSFWMFFIGLKLFQYRDIGRRHFKYYLIFQAISFTITSAYQYFQIPNYSNPVDVMVPGIISTVVILLIMVWLLSLLNKPRVRASLS